MRPARHEREPGDGSLQKTVEQTEAALQSRGAAQVMVARFPATPPLRAGCAQLFRVSPGV